MAQLLNQYTVADSEEIIPQSDFISGLITNGLEAYRYHNKGKNIWTKTRYVARRTNLIIDVSDQKNIPILIDGILPSTWMYCKITKSIKFTANNGIQL